MIQNFDDGYTQDVSGSGTIDYSGKRIEFNDIVTTDGWYAGKTFGDGYFSEFTHHFRFRLSQCDLDAVNIEKPVLALYCHSLGDLAFLRVSESERYIGVVLQVDGTKRYVRTIKGIVTDNQYGTAIEISLDTTYYVKVQKTLYDNNITVSVYTDPAMSQEVGSESQGISEVNYRAFPSFQAVTSYDDSHTGDTSGWVSDFDLDPSCRIASTLRNYGVPVKLSQAIYGTRDGETGQPSVTWVDPTQIKAMLFHTRNRIDDNLPQRGVIEERWQIQTAIPLRQADRVEYDGELYEIDADSRATYSQGKRLYWVTQITKMELTPYV